MVAARIVGPEQALVEAVLPRRTCLPAGGRNPLMANPGANVDWFLVCGLDGDFNLRGWSGTWRW